MNLEVIILGSLVILSAGFLQGFSGFGVSLLAVPFLSLFLPVKLIVPMMAMFSIVLNIFVLYSSRRSLDIAKVWLLVLSGLVGLPIGIKLLLLLDPNVLRIAIGTIVIVAAVALARGYHVQLRRERLASVLAGISSGILGGSITFSGPPVVIFLTNQQVNKETFRANIAFYFLVLNIVGIPVYILSDLVTADVIRHTVALLPALLLGVFAGILAAKRIPDTHFRQVTLVLIGCLGVLSVFSGLSGLQ